MLFRSLLVAALAYVRYTRSTTTLRRTAWCAAALGSYAVSLLSREYAVAFPLVLLLLDRWVLGRTAPAGRMVLEKIPFAAAAVCGAALEWQARTLSSLAELNIGARTQLMLETPYQYVARLLWPQWLSPVYPLPVDGAANWPLVSLLLLVTVSLAAEIGRAHV